MRKGFPPRACLAAALNCARRDKTKKRMNATDRYFTQQIVGTPWEAYLGERVNLPRKRENGVEVSLQTGEGRLANVAQWLITPTPAERATRARRTTPGLREWLHRYSLLLGMVGVLFGVSGWVVVALMRGGWL
jgi:hypothetical protein